jgi:hypothetical protein
LMVNQALRLGSLGASSLPWDLANIASFIPPKI